MITLNIDLSEYEILDKAVKHYFASIDLDKTDLYIAKQDLYELEMVINVIHKLDNAFSQTFCKEDN